MEPGSVPTDAPPLPAEVFMADRQAHPDAGPATAVTDYEQIERRKARAVASLAGKVAPAARPFLCGRRAFAIACTDLLVRRLALPDALVIELAIKTGLEKPEIKDAIKVSRAGGPDAVDDLGRTLDLEAEREEAARVAAEQAAKREVEDLNRIVTLTATPDLLIAVMPPAEAGREFRGLLHELMTVDVEALDTAGMVVRCYSTKGLGPLPLPAPEQLAHLGFLPHGAKVHLRKRAADRATRGRRMNGELLKAVCAAFEISAMPVDACLTLASDEGLRSFAAFEDALRQVDPLYREKGPLALVHLLIAFGVRNFRLRPDLVVRAVRDAGFHFDDIGHVTRIATEMQKSAPFEPGDVEIAPKPGLFAK
ncbi:MAG: hypothetical protein U0235_27805 [Polyangiaceae bacterium]